MERKKNKKICVLPTSEKYRFKTTMQTAAKWNDGQISVSSRIQTDTLSKINNHFHERKQNIWPDSTGGICLSDYCINSLYVWSFLQDKIPADVRNSRQIFAHKWEPRRALFYCSFYLRVWRIHNRGSEEGLTCRSRIAMFLFFLFCFFPPRNTVYCSDYSTWSVKTAGGDLLTLWRWHGTFDSRVGFVRTSFKMCTDLMLFS